MIIETLTLTYTVNIVSMLERAMILAQTRMHAPVV